MGSMTATEEHAPLPAGPLTVADLEAFPDDGHRYELLDGVLVVTPAPAPVHQRVVLRLSMILADVTPDGHELFVAPLAVHPEPGPPSAQRIELQPDVVIGSDALLTDRDLSGAPLLAVEVLSPSTQLFDRNLKRAAYERIGAAHFWLVDPQTPELFAYALDDEGVYQLVAHAVDDEMVHLERPVRVRIRPRDLATRRPPPRP
jgi:Uma2 family endonuclease